MEALKAKKGNSLMMQSLLSKARIPVGNKALTKLTLSDGDYYEGLVDKWSNKPHGEGILKHTNGD